MITFIDLAPGNKFIHEGRNYMKLGAEVCNFNDMGAGFELRLNIQSEDGTPEVGRVAIVYNSADLNTGQLRSFQSEDLVEADKWHELEKSPKMPEIDVSEPDEDVSYTF